MPKPDSNGKTKNKSMLSVGSLFMLTAAVALIVANFGLGPRLESIENEVRRLRFDAAALHVEDRSKIVIVGKPRIRFEDLIYEVYIPTNGSFVICGNGGRESQEIHSEPRVMAPLLPGRHTIEIVTRFNPNRGQIFDVPSIEILLDGKPSILLPVKPAWYTLPAARPSLNATLRYRSYTSFEINEKVILLNIESVNSELENLQLWIQQSADE